MMDVVVTKIPVTHTTRGRRHTFHPTWYVQADADFDVQSCIVIVVLGIEKALHRAET